MKYLNEDDDLKLGFDLYPTEIHPMVLNYVRSTLEKFNTPIKPYNE